MVADAAVRVAVVMGGTSGEHEVSVATGTAVAAELRGDDHLVKPVRIRPDGLWDVADGFIGRGVPASPTGWFENGRSGVACLEGLAAVRDDGVHVVFNALHGPGGEDGSFQGLLRHVGLPFTGPDVIPAAVTMDKVLTKRVLADAGIRTPRWFALPRSDGPALEWGALMAECQQSVPFPWVVKPRCLGSSVGVEIFHEPVEFLRRATEVGEELWCPRPGVPGSGCFVEELIVGRELSCAVLDDDHRSVPLPPIEIRPLGAAFFDYDAKYRPGASEELCPAPLSESEEAAVKDLSRRVHEVFECAPLSRTDLFLDPLGDLVVLEVNTLPGMTATSLVPRAARVAGIPPSELYRRLVSHALERETRRETVASG